MEKHYVTLDYVGSSGEVVRVEPDHSFHRPKWSVQFNTSRLRFHGFKNKFDALLFAAHKCRKSGERMNWIPTYINQQGTP